MEGTVHLSTGQEAVSSGVCAHLRRDDFLVPSFRGHGEFLAKGGSPRSAMAEIFAKDTGCARGMSGSMHLGDPDLRIVPGMAIVGAGIPIAVGLALGAQMRRSSQVAVVIFGDGAANCGYFHEGLNLAAIWNLPVVFICVNNLYAVSTRYQATTACPTIAERAAAYSMEGIRIDGNDGSWRSSAAAGTAIFKARSGAGSYPVGVHDLPAPGSRPFRSRLLPAAGRTRHPGWRGTHCPASSDHLLARGAATTGDA